MNRPAQGNQIDFNLAAELCHACVSISQDQNVLAVIVTGSGTTFSAGRTVLPAEVSSGPVALRQTRIAELQVADALANLTVPIIVSINGDALDHGLELALAGDIRICAESARFGLTDLLKPGCFPWDGGTQRLPRLVGSAWAADMLLTSRVISASEALAIGLVNRVVPSGKLTQETQRLAALVAAGGPIAARYAKEAVAKGSEMSLVEGLRLEADLNIILQSTTDRAEGIQSFSDKRPPLYTGK